MPQPESRLSRKIMQAWRKRGVYCYKVHGSEFTPAGTPDIVGCYRGHFIYYETKIADHGNKPTEIQYYRMEQMKKAGAIGDWGTSVSHALTVLDRVDSILDNKE